MKVTAKIGMFSDLFRVVRMGSERKFCRICRENVLTKFGSCAASVSLFLETSNKNFHVFSVENKSYWESCCRVLEYLLSPGYREPVCRNYIRMVVNC